MSCLAEEQKYVAIDVTAYRALYRAIPNLKVWAVAGLYGNYHETWWGNEHTPLLWARTHKETQKTEFFVISQLIPEAE